MQSKVLTLLPSSHPSPAGTRLRGPRATKQHAPTVAGAIEEWLLDRQSFKNLSQNSIDWYRRETKPMVDVVGAHTPVTNINMEVVRQLIGEARNRPTRQGGRLKDSSVHAEFRAIRAFVRWCARQGWEMDSRLLLMENPEVTGDEVDIFTPAEVRQIQEYFASSLRNRLIVGLLLGTGIRLAELAGVKLADKHDDRLEVLGKGRKKRWVPLSLQLQKDWTRYVERERPKVDSGALLVGEHGRPFKGRGIQMMLYRAGKALGIHVHPHKFRHTFATWFIRKHLEQGQPYDMERLRVILGHANYSLFPRYVHLAQTDGLVRGWDRVAPY